MSLASYFLLIFFVKKYGKEIRFYINYKGRNAIIKNDRYLISLIKETLTQLEGIKYFIKINICQIFY